MIAMFEVASYHVRRRLRGTLALAVGISLVTLLYVGLWPSMEDLDLDQWIEEFPPFFQDMFGIIELNSIEGFLATELYTFIWTVLLGLYFGYLAAGTIAGDLERNRLDLTLSMPLRRRQLVGEQFLSLLVPVVLINAVVGTVVFLGAMAVGESIALDALLFAHAFSIPYFTVCLGIGLVLSALFSRADLAQRGTIGAIFVLWIVDSISETVNESWLGTISPSRYYSPSEILVEGATPIGEAAVLVGMTAVLLLVTVIVFDRRDIAG